MSEHLRVDPIACTGHGLCAELVPELVLLDEWGYPIVSDAPVRRSVRRHAVRAVTDCPALALRLQRQPGRPDQSGHATPGVSARARRKP